MAAGNANGISLNNRPTADTEELAQLLEDLVQQLGPLAAARPQFNVALASGANKVRVPSGTSFVPRTVLVIQLGNFTTYEHQKPDRQFAYITASGAGNAHLFFVP